MNHSYNLLFRFITDYYSLGFKENFNPFFLEGLKKEFEVILEKETEKILQPIYSKITLCKDKIEFNVYKHQVLVILCIKRTPKHKIIYNGENIQIPPKNILICTSNDNVIIKKSNGSNIYAIFSYAYKYYMED